MPSDAADREGRGARLVGTFHMSKKMRPFVNRMRMRIDGLDLSDLARASQFECSCEEMQRILNKKKIPAAKATRAIAQTLEAAADHQLQTLRQEQRHRDRVRSADDVERLIVRLQGLAEAIAKLPPVSKKTLNLIVAQHTARFFDTETFGELICALADALPKLAPRRHAQNALDAIFQPILGVVRTTSSELIELWETMSAESRRQIEQAVQSSAAKKTAIAFLRHLIVLLVSFPPKAKPGRLRTIQRVYITRVSAIWESLSLKVGLAYDGFNEHNIESRFQRFASLALTAVGDCSAISRRQVAKPKKVEKATTNAIKQA